MNWKNFSKHSNQYQNITFHSLSLPLLYFPLCFYRMELTCTSHWLTMRVTPVQIWMSTKSGPSGTESSVSKTLSVGYLSFYYLKSLSFKLIRPSILFEKCVFFNFNKHSGLQNDLKELTRRIEAALHDLHAQQRQGMGWSNETLINKTSLLSILKDVTEDDQPFAKIGTVQSGSPADQAVKFQDFPMKWIEFFCNFCIRDWEQTIWLWPWAL